MYATSSVIALLVFWLLLSGHYTVFLISAGVLCAFAVVAFAHRMDVVDHEGHPIHLGWRAFNYWPWLLLEIIKAAWDVSKIILNPRLPISPTLISVKTTQKTALGVVIYANSITLTPGTISVEVGQGEILVHALTNAGAAGLSTGEMDRRVTQFERSA